MAEDKCVIWPATKIKYAYDEDNYLKPGVGILGKSCMRYKRCQRSINFYIKNKAKIVVITQGNKIKARAILWPEVYVKDKVKPITYMDRVYHSEEDQLPLFYKFAVKNKWRTYYGARGTDKVSHPLMWIEDINIKNIIYLPYMDTFYRLYRRPDGNTISNKTKWETSYLELHRHSDNYFRELDPNSIAEYSTGNYMSKKDCVFIKRYDGWVAKTNIIPIGTTYYSRHDSSILECSDGTYCLRVDAVEECFTGGYMHRKNSVKLDKYNGYVSALNLIVINGEQYHKQDKLVVCYDDHYFLKKHCFKSENGNSIPKHRALILSDIKLIDGVPTIVDAVHISDFNLEVEMPFVMTTGEFVRDTKDNRQYTIRRSGKVYLRHLYTSKTKTEKNQLKFSFMVS